MGFLPYNHLLLYGTDFLNVMHVSKYSGGLAPSDTPAHTRRVITPHTLAFPSSLFAAPVSPVGMVTLPSPSQATLAGPPTHPNGSVGCVRVSELAQMAWLQTSWHSATASPRCLLYRTHLFSIISHICFQSQ